MGFERKPFNCNKYGEPEEKNRTIDIINMFCYYVPKLVRYRTFKEGPILWSSIMDYAIMLQIPLK